MADLTVTPEHLDQLAALQDQAAKQAGSAASAASGISTDLWVTHGVISAPSNIAVTKAEEARRAAGEAIQRLSTELAANLRTANEVYEGADEQAGANLDKQVLTD